MRTISNNINARRLIVVLLLIAGLSLLIAIPVLADNLILSATLTGAAEVPGPGDPDGSGSASIILNTAPGTVCFELQVSDIQTATAAHIHRGAVDVAGPVVVPLDPPDESGMSSGCVSDGLHPLIKEMRRRPRDFYVNVHNAEYPAGAVRGQLSK